MPDTKQLTEGDEVVVTEGVYAGQTGTITRVHLNYYEVGGLIQPRHPYGSVTRLLKHKEVREVPTNS